mgnify:CR=1 FL=1|jgi:hypothetical protein|tara:strand:- start:1623 stop:2078 length:456 start_codon:yes stop_codon:yes gene_type:complete
MATLTVNISEDITLNGKSRGSEVTQSIASISEVYHRIMNVTQNVSHTLIELSTAANATEGQKPINTGLQYLRVTNLDGSNNIVLEVIDSSSEEYGVLLGPGESYILNNSKIDANAAGDSSIGASGDMTDIDKIAATGNGGACDVEVFAAIT